MRELITTLKFGCNKVTYYFKKRLTICCIYKVVVIVDEIGVIIIKINIYNKTGIKVALFPIYENIIHITFIFSFLWGFGVLIVIVRIS